MTSLCLSCCSYDVSSWRTRVIHLPMFFRVSSLAHRGNRMMLTPRCITKTLQSTQCVYNNFAVLYTISSLMRNALRHWDWNKSLPFPRRYFHTDFLARYLYCFSNFTDIRSQRLKWQYTIIGQDNGLAPNRRQAIIWTKDRRVNWSI